MKKPYTAPELFAESFRVCEHIANCTVNGTSNTQSSQTGCEYLFDSPDGPLPLFLETDICSIVIGDVNLEEYWGPNWNAPGVLISS